MPDREKVISGLKKCAAFECNEKCPYSGINYGCRPRLMLDAVELLKEQEPVVLCKDCKHYKDGFCYNPNTYDDEKTKGNTVPDWFCGDGERKERR